MEPSCPSCDLQILDMRTDTAAQTKARRYGVTRVPAVAVNGKLAHCCGQSAVEANALRVRVGMP